MSGDRHVAGAEDLSPELLTAAAVFSTLETSDAALLACERISKRLRAVLLSSPVYRNKCKKILARAGPLSGVDVQAERLRGGAGGRRVVQAVLLAKREQDIHPNMAHPLRRSEVAPHTRALERREGGKERTAIA